MRRRGPLATLALLLASCGAATDEGPVVALTGATVLDPATSRTLPDAVILIRAGHIVAVGDRDRVRIPRRAQEVALQGQWIIPGLIDLRAALEPWGRTLAAQWGVTATRDLVTHAGAASPEPMATRQFASVLVDGTPATQPEAHRHLDSAATDAYLRAAAASGVRGVHLTATVGAEAMAQVVRLARAHGLAVSADLGVTDAMTAAQLGVAALSRLDGIPAAVGLLGAVAAAVRDEPHAGLAVMERAWLDADPVALEQLAAELASIGVTLVPTLAWHEMLSRLDDSTLATRRDLSLVPAAIRAEWPTAWHRALGWDAGTMADLRLARRGQDRFLMHFLAAGGRVATGSGAGLPYLVPGPGIHEELALLVQAGLSPWQALAAATVRGAELLRADSLGRIHEGAAADLVVLDGDPLRDIRNTRRIARVMLAGEWVRR